MIPPGSGFSAYLSLAVLLCLFIYPYYSPNIRILSRFFQVFPPSVSQFSMLPPKKYRPGNPPGAVPGQLPVRSDSISLLLVQQES